MKTLVFVVLFLLMGAFFIISNNNLALAEGDNAVIFLKTYSSWGSDTIINLATTGSYLLNLDWMPANVVKEPESEENADELNQSE